jgi:hypothetical protein
MEGSISYWTQSECPHIYQPLKIVVNRDVQRPSTRLTQTSQLQLHCLPWTTLLSPLILLNPCRSLTISTWYLQEHVFISFNLQT